MGGRLACACLRPRPGAAAVSGLDQLQFLSWLLYILVFASVLVRTIRRPTPAHVDVSLFFGAIAILVVLTGLASRLHLVQPEWLVNDVSGALAMSMGYLLLRLVQDFTDVPKLVLRAVEVGFVASVVAILILPSPLPGLASIILVAYLVLVLVYGTWAFARQATRTHGVTSRRMQAAAAGSLCVGLALSVTSLSVGFPELAGLWTELGAAVGLASGVFYFVAFAPPTWLRRVWQDPELRAFLGRASHLPHLPATGDIVKELERGTADALGASEASIALSDPDTPPVTGRAFLEQRATLITKTGPADPEHAADFERYRARAILSAPITAGETRLGVLNVYAPRAPVFANSDLELVQFMADQAAVILQTRALIEESASLRAREEAVRLKEDFLSSAAHDLKTPLTTLITQAQVLLRRAERNPDAAADRSGLSRLLEQSLRLKDLTLELLDVSRLEHASLLNDLEEVDLRELLMTMVGRDGVGWQRVDVEAEQPVYAAVDALRFEQALTNLVENALKYSPIQSRVLVRLGVGDGEARISIQDNGIGIPTQDQHLVFDRFYRARNVDDRRFAGMGLGLYIARGIVVQHGGRIWLQSAAGEGSTFFIAVKAAVAGPQLIADGSLANA